MKWNESFGKSTGVRFTGLMQLVEEQVFEAGVVYREHPAKEAHHHFHRSSLESIQAYMKNLDPSHKYTVMIREDAGLKTRGIVEDGDWALRVK